MTTTTLNSAHSGVVRRYLRENFYTSVEHWARSNDYLLTDEGWVDLDDNVVPDIEARCYQDIEAEAESSYQQRYTFF